MITQERLKELFHYCPDTGIFTRLINLSGGAKAGDIAGHNLKGYLRIVVDGAGYQSHRLAFLYMTGSFPAHHTDHINGVKNDNRWCNLRDVSSRVNSMNKKTYKNNKSGHTGVYFNKKANRWYAQIKVNYKRIHLGLFERIEDAIDARVEADIKYGFHPNHGR